MSRALAAAGDPRRAGAQEAVRGRLLGNRAVLFAAPHTHPHSPTRGGHQLNTPRWSHVRA